MFIEISLVESDLSYYCFICLSVHILIRFETPGHIPRNLVSFIG